MNDFVGPWVRRFLVEYVIGERNYSTNTQHSYRDAFRLLLPWAAKQCRCTVERLPLGGIKPKLLREFTRHLEQVRHCGPATINQRLAALRAWAHFVATQSPEHLEWSAQVQTIHLKKCAEAAPRQFLEWAVIEQFQTFPDGGIRFGKGEESPLSEAGQNEALDDLHPYFCLGLVFGFADAGGNDCRAVVLRHFLIRGVDHRFVPAGFGYP